MRYERSSALFKEAQRVIPGGVNSPVRAFKSVGGTPVFFKEAKGAHLRDEDDNQYVDFINSWGPMILGHAHEPVVNAVLEKVKKGTSFGAPTELETAIAELIVDMVPGIDMVRMVNSGTEACMSAIRLARGYTKRDKFIKFAGCYHGHSDAFLIKAGSGAVTFGAPDSQGVTKGTAKDTLLAEYNNIDSVKQLIAENKDEIAAVIIEPVAGNMGCIPPKQGFLEELRAITIEAGICLIFDEVMTGFRLARGGAQELLGIEADIVTFGKVIGGGMPVGAFAARKEIMSCVAPLGGVYQAGTLSGNPVAMAAGYALLKEINETPDLFEELAEKTKKLADGIHNALNEQGIVHQINRLGSMMSVHFCDEAVSDFDSAMAGNNARFKAFFHGLLDRGVYLPPSAFESWFICNALSEEDIAKTVKAASEVALELKNVAV